MADSQLGNPDLGFAKVANDTMAGLGALADKDFHAAMDSAEEMVKIQEDLNRAINELNGKIDAWGRKSIGNAWGGTGSYANRYYRMGRQAEIGKYAAGIEHAWASGSQSVDRMTVWRSIVPDFSRLKRMTRALNGVGTAIAIWEVGTEIYDGKFTKAANMTVGEVVKSILFSVIAWEVLGGLMAVGFPPVFAALFAVGVAMVAAEFVDEYVLQPIMEELNEFGAWLGRELYDWVNPDVNQDYEAAKNWHHPCDPFTLDLDGDGIETSAIAGWNGLKFDHDADGVKEGTGWVSADDGLLVLDRDGNGTIDSGRELFGDNTLLSNGQLAANAYEALADRDGNGDGKIDASDSVFNDLRVWQDRNHDGISQADELHTLAELGINSISTESTGARLDQNGNRVTATGTFLRTDGSTGQTGSLMLAGSSFFTEFTDQIEIPETHRELPDMHGSGAVRYLREAAVLSSC